MNVLNIMINRSHRKAHLSSVFDITVELNDWSDGVGLNCS